MGNGEAKELICMTHGHELIEGTMVGWNRAEWKKREERNRTTL